MVQLGQVLSHVQAREHRGEEEDVVVEEEEEEEGKGLPLLRRPSHDQDQTNNECKGRCLRRGASPSGHHDPGSRCIHSSALDTVSPS